MLRSCIISRISDIEKTHGVSRDRAAMSFTASDEFKDMLFEQYSRVEDSNSPNFLNISDCKISCCMAFILSIFKSSDSADSSALAY
jgi:hypothetical protein